MLSIVSTKPGTLGSPRGRAQEDRNWQGLTLLLLRSKDRQEEGCLQMNPRGGSQNACRESQVVCYNRSQGNNWLSQRRKRKRQGEGTTGNPYPPTAAMGNPNDGLIEMMVDRKENHFTMEWQRQWEKEEMQTGTEISSSRALRKGSERVRVVTSQRQKRSCWY